MAEPIGVGDFVEVGGAKRTVRELQILNTMLDSSDAAPSIVPNAQVTGSDIIDYTANGTRRVDWVMGVSDEDDPQHDINVNDGAIAGATKC